MFEELNKHRQAVSNNIAKSFSIDIEKAHQVGDVHPNGKYVWTEYKPGKFGFRAIKKNTSGRKPNASTTSKESEKKSEDKKADANNSFFKKHYDEDSNETWYEGKVSGKRVSIIQEVVGDKDWWNVKVDGKYVMDANDRAMTFKTPQDALDEIIDTVGDEEAMDFFGAPSKKKDGTGGADKTDSGAKRETSDDKKTASEPSFKKKHYFKNVRNMAGSMNVYLEDKVDIQPFVKILGETVHDKGPGTRFRHIRAGEGVYGQSLCETDSYLQNDYTGDYLQFKKKPTEKQLDECAKLLKEKLWADGYKVEPKFYVKRYNDAYQDKGTYGIGIRINVNEKNFKDSSK